MKTTVETVLAIPSERMTKSQINKFGEKLRSLRARLHGRERTIRAILETMIARGGASK